MLTSLKQTLLQMVALYKDPHGKNVFKRVALTTQVRSSGTSGSNTNTTSTGAAEGDGERCELTVLRERVTQLEERLKLYEEREDLPEH